jgi:RimJ/RimL family protein N-acetyltransferase
LPEIVSFTAVINQRSQRVMQRLGMRQYQAEAFDHPALPEGDRLRRHVLYRLSRERWLAQSLVDDNPSCVT